METRSIPAIIDRDATRRENDIKRAARYRFELAEAQRNPDSLDTSFNVDATRRALTEIMAHHIGDESFKFDVMHAETALTRALKPTEFRQDIARLEKPAKPARVPQRDRQLVLMENQDRTRTAFYLWSDSLHKNVRYTRQGEITTSRTNPDRFAIVVKCASEVRIITDSNFQQEGWKVEL